jgi:UDP-2,3-diacylglucosamine pyrophosphatase LpxH
MEKLLMVLKSFILVMFLSLCISCNKSDPDPVINPFSDGSTERTMIVIMSDMHLGADLDYAECKANRAPLENLLNQIRVSQNVKELVIGGDLIDEWYVPANIDTYAGLEQSDFVQRLALTNKGVFDALNHVIQDGLIKVTYVPGNHDLAITNANVDLILPGINQARDDQQGVGTYVPDDLPFLAIEHGHRYNFACAPDPISNENIASGSIMPPGYFFTRIAALSEKQGCKKAGGPMPVVIQNVGGDESQALAYEYYQGWVSLMSLFPIKNKFDEKVIVTNINGFTENYSIDDVMPYQITSGGFIDMNLFKGIQDSWDLREDANKVAVKFPASQAIADQDDNNKTDDQAKTQYFLNPESDKRIVVFGHTHVPKIIVSENYLGLKSIYANSGTWVDKNNKLTTMNFVVIKPQSADPTSQTHVNLYYFKHYVVKQMDADSLRY